MREYTIRNDGLCNTITTVPKDNYIAEYRVIGAAMRGRYSKDGKSRAETWTEQPRNFQHSYNSTERLFGSRNNYNVLIYLFCLRVVKGLSVKWNFPSGHIVYQYSLV